MKKLLSFLLTVTFIVTVVFANIGYFDLFVKSPKTDPPGNGSAISRVVSAYTPQVYPDTQFEVSWASWSEELNPKRCESNGDPVVNIEYDVKNDMALGAYGYWGNNDYQRNIRIWRTDERGVFCALVEQEGDFRSHEGALSPQMGVALDGDEEGTFHGGYRVLVFGELLDEPGWPQQGSVSEVDYGCSFETAACPGSEGWVSKYFGEPYGAVTEWWGWVYEGWDGGEWIFTTNGSVGDIN